MCPVLENITPPPAPSAYEAWRLSRSGDDLNRVIKEVDPIIQMRLGSMGIDNPKMRAHARLLAAKAVQSYNPESGANLKSWVTGNLQGLARTARAERSPGQVPERAQLDAWHLNQAEKNFIDERGYEPDVKELADYSHLSPQRIGKVRRLTRSVGSTATTLVDPSTEVDHLPEALDYVYDEADKTDRRIIEMLTGYGGNPPLSKVQAAAALGIDPAQITRRSAKIAAKVQELEQALDTTT